MGKDLRDFQVIGRPTPKMDARVKAAGRAEYADDIVMPGMLHGKLLRSPHPHARIVSIDTSRAAALPGVRAVVVGSEFPNIKFGNLPQTRDYLPLAIDTVRYIGEEVAAVAAIDEDTAEEALDLLLLLVRLLRGVRVVDELDDDVLRARVLGLEELQRRAAPVARRAQAALGLDGRAERNREAVLFIRDLPAHFGDVPPGLVGLPEKRRAAREPADGVQVLRVHAVVPLVFGHGGFARGEVAGRDLEAHRPDEVAGRGEFARRGGIVDCFPPSEQLPVRIEFFGDEIDSLRSFDPTDQRSLGASEGVVLLPASEFLVPAGGMEAIRGRLGRSAARLPERLAADLRRFGEAAPASSARAGSTSARPSAVPGSTRGSTRALDVGDAAEVWAAILAPATGLDHLAPGTLLVLDEPGDVAEAAAFLWRQADERRGELQRRHLGGLEHAQRAREYQPHRDRRQAALQRLAPRRVAARLPPAHRPVHDDRRR